MHALSPAHATNRPWWPQWPRRTKPAAVLLGIVSKYIKLVRRNSVLLSFSYNLVVS
jgi:hypothetical protein